MQEEQDQLILLTIVLVVVFIVTVYNYTRKGNRGIDD
jgi:hypothetical protein